MPLDPDVDENVDILATQAVIDRGIGRARLLVKWTKRQVRRHAVDTTGLTPTDPDDPPAIKF